jgi:hypothetical protein
MEARLSILFYGKKTRNESDKILSIYLRVTIKKPCDWNGTD